MGNLASNWREESSRVFSVEVPGTADNLDALAQELLANVAASGIAIVREDPELPGALVCVVSLGTCVPLRAAHVDPNSGISGRCVRERRSQRCYDTRIDPRVERVVSERLGIRSLVAVPLFIGSRCIGLIEAVSDRPGHFDEQKAALVESAAKRAAALFGEEQNSSEPASSHVEPPSAREAAQPMDAATFSREIEQSPPEQADVEPSPVNTETALQLGEEERDAPRRLVSWLAPVAAALIAVFVSFYFFHRRTNDGVKSSNQVSAHTSPSDLPAVPALTQNQKTATRLANKASSSGAAPPLSLSEGARRGVIPDQISLAEAYINGDSVPKSLEKAASWYIIAGENGSAKAKRRSIEVTRGMAPMQIAQIRFDVGRMYMDGIGTRKDYVAAYRWFELSKAAGDIRAEHEEEILRTRMQPAQAKEGRHRASVWLQSHLARVHHHE